MPVLENPKPLSDLPAGLDWEVTPQEVSAYFQLGVQHGWSTHQLYWYQPNEPTTNPHHHFDQYYLIVSGTFNVSLDARESRNRRPQMQIWWRGRAEDEALSLVPGKTYVISAGDRVYAQQGVVHSETAGPAGVLFFNMHRGVT